MHIFIMSVTYLQSAEKIQWKLLEELISQSMPYQLLFLDAVIQKWLSYKPCKFVKIHFFSIKLLHAHFQYVCNISAKCWKDLVKALRGVDFTMYALTTIIYKVHLSENG